jgi:hypothetical protein
MLAYSEIANRCRTKSPYVRYLLLAADSLKMCNEILSRKMFLLVVVYCFYICSTSPFQHLAALPILLADGKPYIGGQ